MGHTSWHFLGTTWTKMVYKNTWADKGFIGLTTQGKKLAANYCKDP